MDEAGEVARLRAQLVEAHAIIAELRGQVAAQAGVIEQLSARLGMDSTNSSKPPSSDGYGRSARQRRGRGASGRRAGKQPGAPGAHLAMVDAPDELVVHAPERCAHCDADLAGAQVTGVVRRQVFDLPPVRLRVVEHRVQRRRCPRQDCQTVTGAAFPAQARARACYGPGVRALICYLAVHQHLPTDRLAQLLSDVLGARVATGTVSAVVAEAAERLDAPEGFLDHLRERLVAAPVACFDETGARVDGRLRWLHAAVSDELALFTVHPRRGVAAMDAAGVLPAFRGTAVHDGWKPYGRYDQAEHQLCNAHHLRELDFAAERLDQDWASGLIETLIFAKREVEQAKAAGAERLDADTLAAIRARYAGHIAQGHAANPPPARQPGQRGRLGKNKAANLLQRLDAQREDVLRFTTDFRVPFDDNLVERDLRMVRLQQKISGCWRSMRGAAAFCATRSYLVTARRQRRPVLTVLRELFDGEPWLPPAPAPA